MEEKEGNKRTCGFHSPYWDQINNSVTIIFNWAYENYWDQTVDPISRKDETESLIRSDIWNRKKTALISDNFIFLIFKNELAPTVNIFFLKRMYITTVNGKIFFIFWKSWQRQKLWSRERKLNSQSLSNQRFYNYFLNQVWYQSFLKSTVRFNGEK